MCTIFSNSIHIYKTDDEWWIVYLPEIRIWHKDLEHPWCYYKCDQLYGLNRFYEKMIFFLLNNKDYTTITNREKFPQFPWR